MRRILVAAAAAAALYLAWPKKVTAMTKQVRELILRRRVHPLPPEWRKVSAGYGWRTLNGAPDYHEGVDYPAPKNTEVKAADSGVVAAVDLQGGTKAGRYVTVMHADKTRSIYAHLEAPLVEVGQAVEVGQVIGSSGNTGRVAGRWGGYHLHFGIFDHGGGAWRDPELWLQEPRA